METSLNITKLAQQKQTATTKLAQQNGNKPQNNKISATQQKKAAATKLAQHNGNKPQHCKISTDNEHNEISPIHWVVAILLCCAQLDHHINQRLLNSCANTLYY